MKTVTIKFHNCAEDIQHHIVKHALNYIYKSPSLVPMMPGYVKQQHDLHIWKSHAE
jgi:hypothetical protein